MVIVGILAAIAIPNFSKIMERSRLQDAKHNLMAIYAAQKDRNARGDGYCVEGCADDIAQINDPAGGLRLSIVDNGFAYSCDSTNGFQCTAIQSNGDYDVIVSNDQLVLTGDEAFRNPRCVAAGGACP